MPQTGVQANITRDLISGIALTIIIIMISVSEPAFGHLSIALPLPILFYRAKLGRNHALVIPIAAFFAMLMVFRGFPKDILVFLGLIFLGFILAEILELNFSIEKTIITTSVCVVLAAVLEALFYKSITGIDLFGAVSAHITETIAKATELSIKIYRENGIPENELEIIAKSFEKLTYYLIRLTPAFFISGIIFLSWMTLLIARPLLKMKNLFIPDFGNLKLWKAPDHLVWWIIGSALLVLLPLPGKFLAIMGIYGLILFSMVYFFQGVAIISFFLERVKVNNKYLIIGYLLIILTIPQIIFQIALQFGFIVLCVVGFLDMWKNFRKIQIIDTNQDADI